MLGGSFTYVCKSCGREFLGWPSDKRVYCSHKCAAPLRRQTHGDSYGRLYEIWRSMVARCTCESAGSFERYGARGIQVCPAWMEYEVFRDWALANGYEDGLEIDRRDGDGNYEPGNCRWATRVQQMANTRKRCDGKTSKFKGVSRVKDRWRAQIRSSYIGLFCSEIEAAQAYDRHAVARWGEFARLNFPQGGVPS